MGSSGGLRTFNRCVGLGQEKERQLVIGHQRSLSFLCAGALVSPPLQLSGVGPPLTLQGSVFIQAEGLPQCLTEPLWATLTGQAWLTKTLVALDRLLTALGHSFLLLLNWREQALSTSPGDLAEASKL